MKIARLKEYGFSILFVSILILNAYAIYIDSLTPRLLSYCLIFVVYIMHLSNTHNQQLCYLTKICYVSLSFLLCSIISLFVNQNKALFEFQFLWNILQPTVFIMLGAIIAIRISIEQRYKIYKFLMLLIITTIFYDFKGDYITYDMRHFSVYANPLIYGSFILIAFYLIYYMVECMYFKLPLLFLCMYSCVITYSRSSWVSLTITLLFTLMFRHTKELTTYKLINRIVFAVLFSVFLFFFFDDVIVLIEEIKMILTGKLNNLMQSSSAILRLEAISYVMKATTLLSFLIGNGAGASHYLISSSNLSIAKIHTTDNQYLTLYFDYGLVGVFWIYIMFKLVFRNFFSVEENMKARERKMISTIILSQLITAFFFETIGNAGLSATVLSFLGILYQIDYSKDNTDEYKMLEKSF